MAGAPGKQGRARAPSSPPAQRASPGPSQDQHPRLRHRCLTDFAPVPGGARPAVLLLLGSWGCCDSVTWAQAGLSTALGAVETCSTRGRAAVLGRQGGCSSGAGGKLCQDSGGAVSGGARGILPAQGLRGLGASPGSPCFCICPVSNHLNCIGCIFTSDITYMWYV